MMQHNFKIGDTVVRTGNTFRKMNTGATGVVAGVGDTYIQIEGHYAGEHGGELVRFDCAAFELVKPKAAPQPAGGVKYDAGKPRYGLVLGASHGPWSASYRWACSVPTNTATMAG